MLKSTKNYLQKVYKVDNKVISLAEECLSELKPIFEKIDDIKLHNQIKVLSAMQSIPLQDYHFQSSTGYGYNDIARDAVEQVYSKTFETEDALVRPQIISGTHALTVSLFGLLRPNQELLSVTGTPYDSLKSVIGLGSDYEGSLKEWGITYRQVDFDKENFPDLEKIKKSLSSKTRVVLIQRSRGYSLRPSLSVKTIGEIIKVIKQFDNNIVCLVDNCYGEFVELLEPSQVGADIIVGSLIKNPGGGLCATGGYIAGRKELLKNIANRLTAPGLGAECGPMLGLTRDILTGFFQAPHVSGEALKSAVFASRMFEDLGFDVYPKWFEPRCDIVQAIVFNSSEKLISFCKGIQKSSPVDSNVFPEPSPMPGYTEKIIMAAGTFIQGSSIELSADGPLKEPYTVFFQGGLNFEHGKIGIIVSIQQLINDGFLKI